MNVLQAEQSPVAVFPADILLVVFDFMHADAGTFRLSSPRPPSFPNGPAAVCRHWRHVVCSVSAFWSQLNIVIGGPNPTPIDAIRAHLTLSRSRSLTIIIRRDFDVDLASQDLEYGQDPLVRVLEVLYPHVARWGYVRAPELEHATLCPRMFHRTITAAPSMYRDIACLDLTSLRSTDTALSLYSLTAALFQLQWLESLTLRDVSLPIDPSKAPFELSSDSFPFSLASLVLAHLSAATVAEFWRLTSAVAAMSVTIMGCGVPVVPLDMSGVLDLHVLDLGADADLRPLIANWYAIQPVFFKVSRCPTFDDAVLHEMAGTGGAAPFFPRLGMLVLVECLGVSSGAVRAFVEARLHAYELEGEQVVSELSHVMVSSCGPLAIEDREWFGSHAVVRKKPCEVRWDV